MADENPSRVYYVYVLYRADGATPFYIGMGFGKRMFHHEWGRKRGRSHKDNIICAIWDQGLRVTKRVLCDGMTRTEALNLEMEIIRVLGRHPHGPLVNCTNGGEGCSDPTPETRAKMSAAQLVRPPMSAASRAKLSASLRGHQLSIESRARISASNIIAKASPAYRAKMRKVGEFRHGSESCERMSRAHRERWLDQTIRADNLERFRVGINQPEVRAKMSASAKKRRMSIEARTAHSVIMRLLMNDPTTKDKRSAAIRKGWETRRRNAGQEP